MTARILVNEVGRMSKGSFPLLRGGAAAPIKQISRYLRIGAAGEVKPLLRQDSDLPRRALSKVAGHFVYRARRPLLKGGETQTVPFDVLSIRFTTHRPRLGACIK